MKTAGIAEDNRDVKSIFLHGLGQTAASWRPIIETMGDKFEIFCPDLSDWLEDQEACYSNLYQGLEEYCQQFKEPLHVCGLSLGGILAIQYAITHPEKVSSLVLIGTPYKMPKGLLQVQNIVFHLMPPSSFQKMGWAKMDLISLAKSMADLDFRDDLRSLICPVLIVCGEKDRTNKRAALQIKECIPQAEIIMIKQAGHEVNVDNPIALARRLKAFYQGLTPMNGSFF